MKKTKKRSKMAKEEPEEIKELKELVDLIKKREIMGTVFCVVNDKEEVKNDNSRH